VVYNNILLVGTNAPSKITALNTKNGKIIWQTNLAKDFPTPFGGPSPWAGYLVDHKRGTLIISTGRTAS